jgi:VCBS repeat-containing protein
LTDCNGNIADANVTLNFQPQPIAKDDVYEYNGEPFTKLTNVGVLANDVSEGSAEPLTARLKTQALYGFVSLSRDGAFTYSPDTNQQMLGGGNDSVQAASVGDVSTLADDGSTTMQGELLRAAYTKC